MNQSYPDYDVHVVVDHHNDPARAVVDRFSGAPTVRLHTLDPRSISPDCSLKCSCLLEGIKHIGDSELVALIDADTVPDDRWLADLTEAFTCEEIGAVTGNRWFECADLWPGSSVRHVWNAAAIVQMYHYRVPWGGSLAIRADLVRDVLAHLWQRRLFEDTLLEGVLRDRQLQLATAQRVLMVNRESTSLRGALTWIRRQLLDVRLYHRRWPLILLHALSTSAALIASLLLAIANVLAGSWHVAVWLLAALAVYQVANSAMIVAIHSAARTTVAQYRGIDTAGLRHSIFWSLWIPLTQCVYFLAAVAATFNSRVRWRGIDYRISAPDSIQMLQYRPFHEIESSAGGPAPRGDQTRSID